MNHVIELHDAAQKLNAISALPAALDEVRLLEEKYAVALAGRAKAQEALSAACTEVEESMAMLDSLEAALARTYAFLPGGAHSRSDDIGAAHRELKTRCMRAKTALAAMGEPSSEPHAHFCAGE